MQSVARFHLDVRVRQLHDGSHGGGVRREHPVRASCGGFLGVKSRSGELIVMDGENKEIKFVKTAKRTLEEQRWDQNNLEWITVVPWNRELATKTMIVILPEFEVKKGSGRRRRKRSRISR